jgi:hypothetical protein
LLAALRRCQQSPDPVQFSHQSLLLLLERLVRVMVTLLVAVTSPVMPAFAAAAAFSVSMPMGSAAPAPAFHPARARSIARRSSSVSVWHSFLLPPSTALSPPGCAASAF